MAKGLLSRGVIITQGLAMGGNTSITSLAETFLDLFLDSLSRAHDFETLVKSVDVTNTGSQLVLIMQPDYRAVKQVQLIGQIAPLVQTDFATIISKQKVDLESGAIGEPSHFAAFTSEGGEISSLYLWPVPANNSVTANVLYYSVPDPPSDDTSFPWFEDSGTLVSAVADFAASYDRDTIQQVISRNVDIALGRTMAGLTDQGRANAQQLKFDSSVYRVWRGDY